MRILITGGTGFLGSHLARRLASNGHVVTVLRRAVSPTEAIADLDVHHVNGDVGERASMVRAASGQDVVIHTAAGFTGRGERPECFAINLIGTQNVVDACLEARVERLIHVSSVGAIGVPSDRTPATEAFSFNLAGSKLHYHISKHHGEVIVRHGIARGLNAVIVNPAALWGPFRGGYRGAEVLSMIKDARRFRVTSGGVCVAHVEDVVDATVAALRQGPAGDRYILGGDNLTYRDYVTKIAGAVGARPRLVPVPRAVTEAAAFTLRPLTTVDARFQGPYLRAYLGGRHTYYDSGKAAMELGYRPRSFDAILEECVRFCGSSVR